MSTGDQTIKKTYHEIGIEVIDKPIVFLQVA